MIVLIGGLICLWSPWNNTDRLIDNVVSLLAFSMRAKNELSKDELKVVKSYLRCNYKEDVALNMLKRLQQKLNMQMPTRSALIRMIQSLVKELSYADRLILFITLQKLSFMDKELTGQESQLLENYARYAQITYRDVVIVYQYFSIDSEKRRSRSPYDNGNHYLWAFDMFKLSNKTTLYDLTCAYMNSVDVFLCNTKKDAGYKKSEDATLLFVQQCDAYYSLSAAPIWKEDGSRKFTVMEPDYMKKRIEKDEQECNWAMGVLGVYYGHLTTEKLEAAFAEKMRNYPSRKNESVTDKKMRTQIEKAYKILIKYC